MGGVITFSKEEKPRKWRMYLYIEGRGGLPKKLNIFGKD